MTFYNNIPEELRKPALWLQYYLSPDPKKPDKKPRKHPCVKYATPEARAANLRSLDYLLENRPPQKGMQRYVDKAEGFTYIDIDRVREPETGEIQPWAVELIDWLDTYTEVSASGTGFHLVCLGMLPEDFKLDPAQVEIYAGNIPNKLIAMTGDVHDLHFTIENRQEQVRQLLRRAQAGEYGKTIAPVSFGSGAKPEQPTLISPKEVVVVDMPDTVFDGRLGEICQRRLATFPIAYSWGALVTCAGTLVPRSETHGRKSEILRTNLYWCPVGGQGSGKTQAIEQALNCLGMWPKHDCLVKGKFGSAEGMLTHLESVQGVNRLLFPDELGHLLEKANIEGSSFPFVLNSAYYDDEVFVTMAKGKKAELSCRLSLAGGVVEEMFGDLFGAKTTGGLHGRFTFGLGPKPFTFLYRPYDSTPENISPVPVHADPEIWDVRDEWVRNYPGLTPRIAEHALRVAAICAAFDGRKVLRTKDLNPALEFAKYQVRVRMVLEPNPGENSDARCAFGILGWLRSNAPGGQPVSRRTLYSAIHAARLGPGVFDRALKNLAFNEEIVLGKVGKLAVVSISAADVTAANGSTWEKNEAAQVLPLCARVDGNNTQRTDT